LLTPKGVKLFLPTLAFLYDAVFLEKGENGNKKARHSLDSALLFLP
jgi:hypothetical protein